MEKYKYPVTASQAKSMGLEELKERMSALDASVAVQASRAFLEYPLKKRWHVSNLFPAIKRHLKELAGHEDVKEWCFIELTDSQSSGIGLKELKERLSELGATIEWCKTFALLRYPKASSRTIQSLLPYIHEHIKELTGGKATNGNIITEWV